MLDHVSIMLHGRSATLLAHGEGPVPILVSVEVSRRGAQGLMPDDTAGGRIAAIRRRRGFTQRELSKASGMSLSWIRKAEQGDETLGTPSTEALHEVARALRVPTSMLQAGAVADGADGQTAEDWSEVRQALYGQLPRPSTPVTEAGLLAAADELKPAIAANRYSEARGKLPGLIRDAMSMNGDGRPAQSRVLNMTAWLLTQTRQWDAAAVAAHLALDAADDPVDAGAAVNTECWALLRQGKLEEARARATEWADDIEPLRISRASKEHRAVWGRLLLNLTNACVRDNRPGEAKDALDLAGAAAHLVGREVTSDRSTTRTFGPWSVRMIEAENASILRQPHRVLAIAETIPPDVLHPASASRRRHELDKANALVMLQRYPEAISVLEQLRREAPEWLPYQGYARAILGRLIAQRRKVTPEMRVLADAVQLPL